MLQLFLCSVWILKCSIRLELSTARPPVNYFIFTHSLLRDFVIIHLFADIKIRDPVHFVMLIIYLSPVREYVEYATE